jgi:hypothetical protein
MTIGASPIVVERSELFFTFATADAGKLLFKCKFGAVRQGVLADKIEVKLDALRDDARQVAHYQVDAGNPFRFSLPGLCHRQGQQTISDAGFVHNFIIEECRGGGKKK